MGVIVQILGWIGTFLIILAYILVSNKKVEGNSTSYQVMNLFGALGVGINVLYQRAWPAVALEVIWIVIAVVILVKAKKK